MTPPQYKRRLGPISAARYDGTMTADLTDLLAGVEYQWVGNGSLQIRYAGGWITPAVGDWVARSQNGEVWTVTDPVFRDAYEPV